MCSTRLITTGATAARSAVSTPTHGGARPSSAARTARSASGARTIALCSLKLSTATTVSVAPGTEIWVAGTTRSSVAPIVVKSKCSGTPWSHRCRNNAEPSASSCTAVLPEGGNDDTSSSASSDGAAERGRTDLAAGGGERRALVGRRQRDHVAERRERLVARPVHVRRGTSRRRSHPASARSGRPRGRAARAAWRAVARRGGGPRSRSGRGWPRRCRNHRRRRTRSSGPHPRRSGSRARRRRGRRWGRGPTPPRSC